MRLVIFGITALCVLAIGVLATALGLVASTPPRIAEPRDTFGFADLATAEASPRLPGLQAFVARDGAQLAYRFYDSPADRILIFVHGSSYHGAAYHPLALRLSQDGVARVVTPNLRGHYLSGPRRGDVDYIGQLEDDLQDLIHFVRGQGHSGPITLGGHSSGGGLAIRFAGGAYSESATRFLLLSPLVPTSPSVRGGDAGGWASLHQRRLFGLLALNALGITGFNGLTIIEFNKPAEYWDGTETLAYSYRLNASYHPRYDYARDIAAIESRPTLVLVGEEDEAMEPEAVRALFAAGSPTTTIEVLPHVDHFGVFESDLAGDRIAEWLGGP